VLHSWEERQLREIEFAMVRDDPQFADGLRFGDPAPPQEYRRRRLRRWMLLAALVSLGLGSSAGWAIFNLFGFVAAGWVAVDWLRYGWPMRRLNKRRFNKRRLNRRRRW